jgi:hypothetical protein
MLNVGCSMFFLPESHRFLPAAVVALAVEVNQDVARLTGYDNTACLALVHGLSDRGLWLKVLLVWERLQERDAVVRADIGNN